MARNDVAPLWVNFLASKEVIEPPFVGALVDGNITRYVVDRVQVIKGRFQGPGPEWRLTRVLSRDRIPAYPCDLCLAGVTQHLAYTSSRERSRLEEISCTSQASRAVLIPIRKAEAWWALAQDERLATFQGNGREGHTALGLPFAGKILRRLYHARYLPRSAWDFLTYFEFEPEHESDFRALLAALRNPDRNPEWSFVEQEAEIWLRKTQ